MASSLGTIIQAACRKPEDKLKILTTSTHERNQNLQCLSQNLFYSYETGQSKSWNTNYGQVPSNYFIFPRDVLYSDFSYDLCIVQNIFAHQYLWSLARKVGLPILRIEHCWGMQSKENLLQLKEQFKAEKTVFITDFSRKTWLYEEDEAEVLPHAIQSNIFKPNSEIKKKKHLLAVANDFRNRGYIMGFDIWEEVSRNLPALAVGNTPNYSKPAASLQDLIYRYNECTVFVNTTRLSPIPMALLEAMSCECLIVSTYNGAIPDYLTHGTNALVSNDPKELRQYCEMLLAEPEKYKYLGENARKTVVEKCNVEKYVEKFNNILYSVANNYIFKG